MKVEKLDKGYYIIRVEPGESLMASLEKFARDTKINFAWISVIGGGFKKVKYAFSVGYDTGYIFKDVEGPLELLNATGCIAWDHDDQSKPAVHLHATFIDNELEKAFGGHLIEAESVGLTAEVEVRVSSEKKKITRKLVEEVNVKLLNLPPYSELKKNSKQDKTNEQDNKKEIPWSLIVPVGLAIVALSAIVAYFVSRSK